MVQIQIEEGNSVLSPLIGRQSDEEGRLAMDVFENFEYFVIVVPLAGVSLKNIRIQVDQDILSISGKRDFPEECRDFQDIEYLLQECFWGKFSRSIVLPSSVSTAEIRAKMHDSVLFITMPKAKKANEKSVIIESISI
jgi:HSP20 family protein